MPKTNPSLTHQQRLDRKSAILKLCDQITQLAAHLDAAEYRFLELIEQFCSEEAWKTLGLASCAQWLNWKCGMSMGVAREKVRVAKALPNLPEISRAFSEGRVSYSKVRAMTRVATPKNERVLLNVALHGTANHVEKQVQLYRRVKRIEALKQENKRHDHRQLSWRVDEDGYWTFKGRFTVNIHSDIETLKEDGSNAESELEDCCHVPAGTFRTSSASTGAGGSHHEQIDIEIGMFLTPIA